MKSRLSAFIKNTLLLLLASLSAISCTSTIRAYKSKEMPEDPAIFLYERNIPFFSSSKPAVYFSSSEWMKKALEIIGNARKSILITTFLGSYCDYTAPIYDALVQKAKEGLQVYVIIDSSSYEQYDYGKKNALPMAIDRLKGTGVHVAEYNPISGERIFIAPALLDREHRKYWIIDGTYVATGGINLNYLSFAPYGLDGQIDTFVCSKSAGAASYLIASFCKTWNGYSPRRISPDGFIATAENPQDSQTIPLWIVDQGLKDRGEVDKLFDTFFACAKKEIWMIQGLAYTSPSLIEKIRFAKTRGVDVKIMISENSDREANEIAAKYCIKDMIDAGANVYIYDSPDKGFLHYKLLLADRRLVAFGSANFNFRSQKLSREISFIYNDEEIGSMAYGNLANLLKNARKIEREEAERYRSLKYSLIHAFMLFGG